MLVYPENGWKEPEVIEILYSPSTVSKPLLYRKCYGEFDNQFKVVLIDEALGEVSEENIVLEKKIRTNQHEDYLTSPRFKKHPTLPFWVTRKGQIVGKHGRFIGSPNKSGYLCVGYNRRQYTVHSLVLETYVGPRPRGAYGCHKNDNKLDNSLENLYWGTPRQNSLDCLRNKGTDHPMVKLTEEKVLKIRQLHEQGAGGYKTIAKLFDVSSGTIKDIIKRKTWNHI
jgi:hypothetical protein